MHNKYLAFLLIAIGSLPELVVENLIEVDQKLNVSFKNRPCLVINMSNSKFIELVLESEKLGPSTRKTVIISQALFINPNISKQDIVINKSSQSLQSLFGKRLWYGKIISLNMPLELATILKLQIQGVLAVVDFELDLFGENDSDYYCLLTSDKASSETQIKQFRLALRSLYSLKF